MDFDEKTLQKVAEISRLKLSSIESAELVKDLSIILGQFKTIQDMDSSTSSQGVSKVPNPLREDEVKEPQKEVLDGIVSQFPKKEGAFVIVPKSME